MIVIPTALVLVVLGLLAASVWLTVNDEHFDAREVRFLRWIFLGALIPRLSLAIGSYIALPYGYFAPDEVGYATRAAQLAGHPLDLLHVFSGGGQGWFYFNAVLIQLFGVNPLAPRLLNCVVGAYIPVLGYLIARRLGAGSGARWTAILLATIPSLVLWSSLNLKDADVLFLILTSLLVASRLQERVVLRQMLILALMLGVLYTLRQYTVFALLVAIVSGILATRLAITRSVGLALGSVAAVVLGGAILFPDAYQTLYAGVGLDQLAVIRHNLAAGARSAVDVDPGLQTFGGAIAFLPRGMVDLLLRPFPWESIGSLRLLVVPETIVYYAILGIGTLGIAISLKSRSVRALQIVVFVVVLSLGYALVLSNLGTSYRERAQVLVVMVAFSGIGIQFIGGYLSRRGRDERARELVRNDRQI